MFPLSAGHTGSTWVWLSRDHATTSKLTPAHALSSACKISRRPAWRNLVLPNTRHSPTATPLKAVQTSVGLPTLSTIGTRPGLVFFSNKPANFPQTPSASTFLSYRSSFGYSRYGSTQAQRPPMSQKRLLKAIATVTKEIGILRIELMVLACSQRASWWQLSLKTMLGQPSPLTKCTNNWRRRKSSCRAGGLRDMGTLTNAASLCHSTYTQRIRILKTKTNFHMCVCVWQSGFLPLSEAPTSKRSREAQQV